MSRNGENKKWETTVLEENSFTLRALAHLGEARSERNQGLEPLAISQTVSACQKHGSRAFTSIVQ
eukprot:4800190-Amphidinium_carterae.1